MNQPLVTVLITTYNQECYIGTAIDSVLAQKTDFPFEIYISEDCGSDGTRAILQDYAARFPEIIRLNLREENVGISRNWYEGLCAAKGQYVCTLEATTGGGMTTSCKSRWISCALTRTIWR